MRKKILSVLLAVTLMAGILSGCGGKEEPKEDKNIENAQEDVEEDKVETDDNAGKVVDLGNGMMMEYPGGDDGLIEMEGEVTVLEEDVVISEGNVVIIEGDVIDWAEAYEDYYAREDILPENMKMSINTAMEGVSMDIVVATVEETSYMRYAFDNAALDLYAVEDTVYVCTEVEGEVNWMYAPVASEEEVDSIFSLSGEDTIVDPEYVTSCTYVEEVVEAGVTYDVLLLEVDDGSTAGETYLYVNRETQKVNKFTMEADGQQAECFVEEISSIELPAEAANATEGTMDDVAMALFLVIFSAADMSVE